MEQVTTYTVKSKMDCFIWVFKYNLNGVFRSFEVLDGELSPKQYNWLFNSGQFPGVQSMIDSWREKLKENFEIIKAEPVLDFDVFWKLYPYNPLSKKKTAKERWEKLKDAQKIKLLMKLPEYKKLKTKEGTSFPYAEVFIKGGWWDD
ncbi:hypothetical protein JJC03_15600 [Flavobacterium oreochromis]|uniref:hypothetical protein n=1 Tax=Flavobacterium oreochromis TaxID=2906078 RepID=UPI001CE70AFF|nr:hypothetical protein [Flavobacterium oreochromis]QYS86324.1 hypothetical protein JJC03_15600 [Flavobacterium oreochromis]